MEPHPIPGRRTLFPVLRFWRPLDEFEQTDVLEHTRSLTPLFLEKLSELKSTGVIAKVRGEGMVFGIECAPMGDLSAHDVANAIVESCYLGEEGGDGIHLLGALAGKSSSRQSTTHNHPRTSGSITGVAETTHR